MKRNAIARIIIFILLIGILSGILLFGLCFDSFSWDLFGFHVGSSTSGSLQGGTPSDSANFDAADIDEIVIYWISGDIDILGTDTDTVTYETRNNNSTYETHYKLENRRLSIGFHASSRISTKVKTKDLSLTLPTDWDGKLLKIEAVSARTDIALLHDLKTLKIENVSGEVTLSDTTAAQVHIDTVSGDIRLGGHFGSIDMEAVSADAILDCGDFCPEKIDFESVSGDLDIVLPDGYGFDLTLDSVSKTLNIALPYTKDGNHYLSEGKLGTCQIDMDSVSGDISVSAGGGTQASCTHLWDGGQLLTVPGDNRQEMVYTCLLCNATRSETVSSGKLFTVTCANSDTEKRLIEPLQSAYPSGYEVRIVTNIIMDADLHLYINGEFACSYTPQTINDQQYWVFSFVMPEKDVVIALEVVGGM